MINLPGCMLLPPEVAQIRKIIEKFKDKKNLIDKKKSNLFIECFGRNKSCQKWYFKQLIAR